MPVTCGAATQSPSQAATQHLAPWQRRPTGPQLSQPLRWRRRSRAPAMVCCACGSWRRGVHDQPRMSLRCRSPGLRRTQWCGTTAVRCAACCVAVAGVWCHSYAAGRGCRLTLLRWCAHAVWRGRAWACVWASRWCRPSARQRQPRRHDRAHICSERLPPHHLLARRGRSGRRCYAAAAAHLELTVAVRARVFACTGGDGDGV